MKPLIYAVVSIATLVLATEAFATPGAIHVKNSSNHDAYVTVIDLNASGHVVIEKKRINSGETFEISAEIASDGFAKLKWVAENADEPKEIGSNESEPVRENDILFVDLTKH